MHNAESIFEVIAITILVVLFVGLYHRMLFDAVCQPLAQLSRLLVSLRDGLLQWANATQLWYRDFLREEGVNRPGVFCTRIVGAGLYLAMFLVFTATAGYLFASYLGGETVDVLRHLFQKISSALRIEGLVTLSVVLAGVLWFTVLLDLLGVHSLGPWARTPGVRRLMWGLVCINLFVVVGLEVAGGYERGIVALDSAEMADMTLNGDILDPPPSEPEEPSTDGAWVHLFVWMSHAYLVLASAGVAAYGLVAPWGLLLILAGLLWRALLLLVSVPFSALYGLFTATIYLVLRLLQFPLSVCRLFATPLGKWLGPDLCEVHLPVGFVESGHGTTPTPSEGTNRGNSPLAALGEQPTARESEGANRGDPNSPEDAPEIVIATDKERRSSKNWNPYGTDIK